MPRESGATLHKPTQTKQPQRRYTPHITEKDITMTNELKWSNKNPEITATDVRNDVFRFAFDAIARKALPFMDLDYAYHTDLLWDANNAVLMENGARAFLVVRSMGTTWVHPKTQTMFDLDDAEVEADEMSKSCVLTKFPSVVLRIDREGLHDFRVQVLHTNGEREDTL